MLDSNGIDEEKVKSNNSLFMHSLYAVANIGNGPEVIRLYVEEINNPNTKDTAKRAYQIQNIEKVFPASGKVQGNTPSFVTNTVNTIDTIADLVAVVKSRNKNFERAKVSVIVNEDGTPKILYHQTTEDFTVFDPKHPGAGQFDSGWRASV